MGRVMQIASLSLAEVTYAVGGNIGFQIQESARSARFRLRTKQENVSGVLLPAFESYLTEGNNDFAMTGLGKGGQQVQRCRETYARAVEALVELASLQTAFVILDEVIKVVNRRGKIPLAFIVCMSLTRGQSMRCGLAFQSLAAPANAYLLQRTCHHSSHREHH